MSISIELTAILGFGVTAIFWLAGLSFASKRNTEDLQAMETKYDKAIETIWQRHDEFGKEIRSDMSEVKNTLSRIEGRLFNESHSSKI